MKRLLLLGVILVVAALVGVVGLAAETGDGEAAGSPQAGERAPTLVRTAHVLYPRGQQAKPPWAGGGGDANRCDAATGVFVRWPEPAVNYWVNTSNYSGNQTAALAGIDAAFKAWTDVADSSWTASYVDVGPAHASSLPIREDGKIVIPAETDEINSVTWESLGDSYPGAIAVTFHWRTLYGMDIVEVDTVNNSDLDWVQNGSVGDPDTELGNPDSFDVQNIMAHEVGHWLNLGHVNLNDHTMYPSASLGELEKRTLACGDEDGIRTLYPDGSEPIGDVPGYCKKHPERDGCPPIGP